MAETINMRKRLSLIITLLSILLFSIFVYAAGSSTIPSDSNDNRDVEKATVDQQPPQTQNGRTYRNIQDCESISNRRERIKCRLKQEAEESEIDYEKRVPEACRTLRNPTACVALYKNVRNQKCYDLKGREKDKCFKKTVGFSKADIRREVQERAQKARQYIVLLLYDLQERIENLNEDGKITDEDAAEVIDLIVEIKQDILDEKKKPEILPKLNNLKQKIKTLREKAQQEAGGEAQ